MSMAGPINNVTTISNQDNFHRAYTLIPYHHPQINNTCFDHSEKCTLNTVTVTENLYNDLDKLDTGMYPVAASEMKVKMSSRQNV